ncbi:MAG: redox-regulated ATPase YchF [Gammaproteobacteria bacterium]|nr:redox-regulated ATPase YchF [Gammaproteobacteria bacterium]
MGFQCGIVGLPNVGKSTLFNALTKADVPALNYPFCTKDPNVGIVSVPDPRLEILSTIVHPESIVPTTIRFVDIAGLVKGASEGEGLGNQFLAHIRETDAIFHVVRCFGDKDVIHVSGSVSPMRDIEIINTELILADLESIQKRREKLSKKIKAGDKLIQLEYDLLKNLEQHLSSGKPARLFPTTHETFPLFAQFSLLTGKPLLYVANVDETNENSEWLQAIQKCAEQENTAVIPLSLQWEAEFADLSPEDRRVFLSSLQSEEPKITQLIRAGYHLLHLQTFFTAGPKEVRAWTVPHGSTAPVAAGTIHSDFEKGFIRAEVIHYEDFVHYKGEQGAKDAGKWHLEGKDYKVQEGDVVHFRFGT